MAADPEIMRESQPHAQAQSHAPPNGRKGGLGARQGERREQGKEGKGDGLFTHNASRPHRDDFGCSTGLSAATTRALEGKQGPPRAPEPQVS